MAKSPTKDLPSKLRDLAKKEIGENADHVGAHLISFKRWLASSPHLTVPQAAWKPEELEQRMMRTLNNMSFEYLMLQHRSQIGGFGLVIDMSNTPMELIKQWADLKNSKSAFKLMQEASPGRMKHLVFYKESKLIDFVFKMAEAWLSDKMRNRVVRVKDDMDKAFKKVPGLKKILPSEYGGTNGDVKSALAKYSIEFKEHYANGYPLEAIRVNESKRPSSAKNYIKEYKELDSSLMGSSGTYVKIDPVD